MTLPQTALFGAYILLTHLLKNWIIYQKKEKRKMRNYRTEAVYEQVINFVLKTINKQIIEKNRVEVNGVHVENFQFLYSFNERTKKTRTLNKKPFIIQLVRRLKLKKKWTLWFCVQVKLKSLVCAENNRKKQRKWSKTECMSFYAAMMLPGKMGSNSLYSTYKRPMRTWGIMGKNWCITS